MLKQSQRHLNANSQTRSFASLINQIVEPVSLNQFSQQRLVQQGIYGNNQNFVQFDQTKKQDQYDYQENPLKQRQKQSFSQSKQYPVNPERQRSIQIDNRTANYQRNYQQAIINQTQNINNENLNLNQTEQKKINYAKGIEEQIREKMEKRAKEYQQQQLEEMLAEKKYRQELAEINSKAQKIQNYHNICEIPTNLVPKKEQKSNQPQIQASNLDEQGFHPKKNLQRTPIVFPKIQSKDEFDFDVVHNQSAEQIIGNKFQKKEVRNPLHNLSQSQQQPNLYKNQNHSFSMNYNKPTAVTKIQQSRQSVESTQIIDQLDQLQIQLQEAEIQKIKAQKQLQEFQKLQNSQLYQKQFSGLPQYNSMDILSQASILKLRNLSPKAVALITQNLILPQLLHSPSPSYQQASQNQQPINSVLNDLKPEYLELIRAEFQRIDKNNKRIDEQQQSANNEIASSSSQNKVNTKSNEQEAPQNQQKHWKAPQKQQVQIEEKKEEILSIKKENQEEQNNKQTGSITIDKTPETMRDNNESVDEIEEEINQKKIKISKELPPPIIVIQTFQVPKENDKKKVEEEKINNNIEKKQAQTIILNEQSDKKQLKKKDSVTGESPQQKKDLDQNIQIIDNILISQGNNYATGKENPINSPEK